MTACKVLLTTLEDLLEAEFENLKFYLSMEILDGCSPIPKSYLEKATRIDIVRRVVERYGEQKAVRLTVEILRQINNNQAAEQLERTHAGEILPRPPSTSSSTSSSSTSTSSSAAPAASTQISAEGGSVIISPTLGASTTCGSWNITINK